MNPTIRRLQVVGNNSYSVSLPKKWILKNNLDKKRLINITSSNNNLVLSSQVFEKNSTKINIDILDISLIPSIIILCYTKGVYELTLKFSSNKQYLDSKESINSILSCLDGFKIIDEDPKKIVIISLYEKYDISIAKIAKRMTMLINQMVESLSNDKSRTKNILESELDSLYHLSKRILYICSVDDDVRSKNNVLDIEEIFLWRLIFKKLENVGDLIEHANINKPIKINKILKLVNNLNNVFILNKSLKSEVITNLKNESCAEPDLEKIKNLIIDILNNYLLIQLNYEYFK